MLHVLINIPNCKYKTKKHPTVKVVTGLGVSIAIVLLELLSFLKMIHLVLISCVNGYKSIYLTFSTFENSIEPE